MKNIKLNIAQKLLAGFGLILLLIVINGIWTFSTLTSSKTLNRKLTGLYSPSTAKLESLADAVNESKMLIRSWVYIDTQSGTPDKVRLSELQDKEYKILKEELTALSKLWKEEEGNVEDVEKLNVIFNEIDSLFQMEQYVMNSLNSFEAYEDAMVLFEVEPMVQEGGEIITLGEQIDKNIRELVGKYDQATNVALSGSNRSFTVLQWVIIIMSLLVIAGALITAYMLYNAIITPLNKGVTFAKAIGQGDLTATVDVCLLYTSPSPRDRQKSRMPSSA
jgi:methyl-accepting chemotaxis protein